MKKNIYTILALFILHLFFINSSYIYAQAGSLDTAFSNDGFTSKQINTYQYDGARMALQSDGKIVVSKSVSNGVDEDFALFRFNIDGSIDSTFDFDGQATTAIGLANDQNYCLAIQTDGKIVTAGITLNASIISSVAIARFNTDGSIDSTFDSDGIVTTTIGVNSNFIKDMKIQTDGKIVLAGINFNGSNYDFLVLRYNSNGTLDPTFDTDGIVISAIGPSYDVANSLVIQPDGKIILGGYSSDGSFEDFAIVRYNNNGSLDNTFDSDGIATFNLSIGDNITKLTLQPDGKIVAGGFVFSGIGYKNVLLRYNPNGSLDNTFDLDGYVTTLIGAGSSINSLIVQSDSKIITAGGSNDSLYGQITLVRYNSNGSIDNSFDSDGIVKTRFTNLSNETATDILLQSDGKYIVTGYSLQDTNKAIALARYKSVGAVGIKDMELLDENIILFPNPTSSMITLDLGELAPEKTSIILTNLFGQKLIEKNHLENKVELLEIANLNNGMYFVKVKNQDHEITRSILIQK